MVVDGKGEGKCGSQKRDRGGAYARPNVAIVRRSILSAVKLWELVMIDLSEGPGATLLRY